jgi:hypothetical protein
MRHLDIWHFLPIVKDVAFLFASVLAGAWAWFKTRHAQSWPSAQGTIVSANAVASGNSYILPWAASFTYNYVAYGEYYAGTKRIRVRTRRRAEEKIEGWKGRIVAVRFSPSKHDLSTLLPSDQPGGQLGN